MKQKIKNTVIILTSLSIIFNLITNPTLITRITNYSLSIWVENLIPSLFPFFVLSDILINYNITSYIPKRLKKVLTKLWNTSPNTISIFFLSMLSGFPSNARNIRTYYDKGQISTKEANITLAYTHFANPLFILSTTAIFFLHNKISGLIIMISLYLSNIILGIILRGYNPTGPNINFNTVSTKSQNFGPIFVSAIKKSIDTLLLILGILTTFLLLASLLINLINVNTYTEVIIKSIIEITMGLKDLGTLSISITHKTVLATTIITFGGLSVHLQVISQLIGTNIKYKYFLYGRIIGSLLALIISYILCIIII